MAKCGLIGRRPLRLAGQEQKPERLPPLAKAGGFDFPRGDGVPAQDALQERSAQLAGALAAVELHDIVQEELCLCPMHGAQEFLLVDGLEQVVRRAAANGRARICEFRIPRQQDELSAKTRFPGVPHDLHAAHPGHSDVQKHDVRPEGEQRFQRFLAVPGLSLYGKSLRLPIHKALQTPAHQGLIVDKQQIHDSLPVRAGRRRSTCVPLPGQLWMLTP